MQHYEVRGEEWTTAWRSESPIAIPFLAIAGIHIPGGYPTQSYAANAFPADIPKDPLRRFAHFEPWRDHG